jgi:hypothetical protein
MIHHAVRSGQVRSGQVSDCTAATASHNIINILLII